MHRFTERERENKFKKKFNKPMHKSTEREKHRIFKNTPIDSITVSIEMYS